MKNKVKLKDKRISPRGTGGLMQGIGQSFRMEMAWCVDIEKTGDWT